MTILPIGSNCRFGRCVFMRQNRGFTFFELMVTVSILSIGVAMIYKAFFVAIDTQDYVIHRLHALSLLNDRMTWAQLSYLPPEGEAFVYQEKKEFSERINNKVMTFRTVADFNPVANVSYLTQLNFEISWEERGRPVRLARSTYHFFLGGGAQ